MTDTTDAHDSAPEPDSQDSALSDNNLLWDYGNGHHLELVIADERWTPHITDDLKAKIAPLVTFVSALLEAPSFSACLRWTNDDEMASLNQQFRGKDSATNVLSFPDDEADEAGGVRLGDLAFGFEIMAKEAADMQISVESHMCHLIIHGLLHLIGCDHENEEDAEEMEGLEIAALTLIGVDNPYLGELA